MLGILIVLALYPFLSYFVINPISFYWGFTTKGQEPMPAEVVARSDRVGRHMMFLRDALLIAGTYYWARYYDFSVSQFRLQLGNWPMGLLVGLLLGTAWLIVKYLIPLAFIQDHSPSSRHPFLQGSIFGWLTRLAVGAIADELWRVLSLLTLMSRAGFSPSEAVLASSIAFGAGHFRWRLSGAIGAAVFGGILAAHFVWLHSFWVLFAAHFVANFGQLLLMRQRIGNR
jgi:hypothetical protein